MKKIFWSVGIFFLCAATAEIFSFFAVNFLEWTQRTEGVLPGAAVGIYDLKTWNEPQVIHPFLGYVLNSGEPSPTPISPYGFYGRNTPIQARSEGKMIVGIFGGSLAKNFCLSQAGLEALTERLRPHSGFSKKEILFLNFGMGGYKQPQQLMALNYILALGGQFDLVINLDGFNEVALPAAENVPNNVFPFFPRGWRHRVIQETLDPEELSAIALISEYEVKRQDLLRAVAAFPWRYSRTARLIGHCLDRRLNSKISRERFKLYDRWKQNDQYAVTGPSFHYEDAGAMYEDLARVWRNCSLQMKKICDTNGIRYFHFLQPNQYVPNSKPMGPAETQQAFRPEHPYRRHVEAGYPHLQEAGKSLVRDRVDFYDLTRIFSGNDEMIYSDACCHTNDHGHEVLGLEMGEIIARKFYQN